MSVSYTHLDVYKRQVMEVADVINYLGNNYATTAAEIAQSVNDAASMGQLAGVDVKATAAIAASMQAMGVSTDRVGTSIKRIYTNITKGSTATACLLYTSGQRRTQ